MKKAVPNFRNGLFRIKRKITEKKEPAGFLFICLYDVRESKILLHAFGNVLHGHRQSQDAVEAVLIGKSGQKRHDCVEGCQILVADLEGTVDEQILMVLKSKDETQSALLNAVRAEVKGD